MEILFKYYINIVSINIVNSFLVPKSLTHFECQMHQILIYLIDFVKLSGPTKRRVRFYLFNPQSPSSFPPTTRHRFNWTNQQLFQYTYIYRHICIDYYMTCTYATTYGMCVYILRYSNKQLLTKYTR